MAKIEFTFDSSKIVSAIRKAQGDIFALMFDEFDTDFENELNLMGIQTEGDED